MVIAYVLVTTKSGAEKEVLDILKKSSNIKIAKIVYGEYDIIAKIEVHDITALNEYLLTHFRQISGIEKTVTLIVAT
ncbi:MAG: Lrp/AsnC ligand binding domain-containing protein [archaeon]